MIEWRRPEGWVKVNIEDLPTLFKESEGWPYFTAEAQENVNLPYLWARGSYMQKLTAKSIKAFSSHFTELEINHDAAFTEGAYFSNCTVTSSTLTGPVELHLTEVKNSTFTNANLLIGYQCALIDCNFENCTLDGYSFTDLACLPRVGSRGDTLFAIQTKNEILFMTGCFVGTEGEFRSRLDNSLRGNYRIGVCPSVAHPHKAEYEAAITLLKFKLEHQS